MLKMKCKNSDIIKTEFKLKTERSVVFLLTWREAGRLATFLIIESVSTPQSSKLVTHETHEGLSEQSTR